MTFLDIVELREQVTRNLSRTDVLSCLLVSRTWHSWFIPALYRNLTINNRQIDYPDKRASMAEGLRRYGVYVRELTQLSKRLILPPNIFLDPFRFLCDGIASIECNRLTHVVLTVPPTASAWHALMQLFQNNTHLASVYLEGWESHQVDFGMADLFCHTPNLRHLGLNPLRKISSATVDRIFALCPRLESLTLFSINNIVMAESIQSNEGGGEGEGAKTESVGASRLPTPTSSSASENETKTVAALPHLKRLRKLEVSIRFQSAPYLPRLFGLCPHLTHLRLSKTLTSWLTADPSSYQDALSHLPATLVSLEVDTLESFRDEQLSTLLRCMPSSLKQISLLDVQVGPQTIHAIVTCHRTILELLKVRCKNYHILGPDVASVLTLCPRLRFVQIDGPEQHPLHIPVHELVRSPWVCRDLEVFRIAVGVEHESVALSHRLHRKETLPSLDGGSGSGSSGGNDAHVFTPEEAFYDQLGQLQSLVEISLACRCEGGRDPARGRMAVSWTLSHGLAALASLTRLRYLELEDFPPRSPFATMKKGMSSPGSGKSSGHSARGEPSTHGNRVQYSTMSEGMQSLCWMQQHWPQLRQLNCLQLSPERQAWIQGHLPLVSVSTVRGWSERTSLD